MNKASESKYINRTCECLARSFEQYHAMKEIGEDAIKSKLAGIPYHEEESHVPKGKFNTLIKPLIEQFLAENDALLKSLVDSQFANSETDASFELIKSAFDQGQIEEEQYLEYLDKYNLINKADPSHGGKLEKVMMIDKDGKQEVKWVSVDAAKPGDQKPGDKTKHTYAALEEFARDTPEKELKRIINESHDEKLRKAAHKELDRRGKKEKVDPDKKVKAKPKTSSKAVDSAGNLVSTDKDQQEKNDKFKHHRLLAAYHSGQAISMSAGKMPMDKQKLAEHLKEGQKHANAAKELHNKKEHGGWMDSIPDDKDAREYAEKHYKESK
jgi:hypothetical protein